MAVRWLLKDKPRAWHRANSELHLDLNIGNEDTKDGFPLTRCIFCRAERTQHALPLLAVLAAASVVVFIAYLCSLSIRRKTPTLSMGRKLAASGEEDETDGSKLCTRDTGTPPRTPEDPPLSHTPEDPPLSRTPSSMSHPPVEAESAEVSSSPWLRKILAASSKRQQSLASAQGPQQNAGGDKKRVNRKRRRRGRVQRRAKLIRLKAPKKVTEPTKKPQPPEDPGIDSSVKDSEAPKDQNPLSEQAWLQDEAAASSAFSSQQAMDTPADELSLELTEEDPFLEEDTLMGPLVLSTSSSSESSDSSEFSEGGWLSDEEEQATEGTSKEAALRKTHSAVGSSRKELQQMENRGRTEGNKKMPAGASKNLTDSECCLSSEATTSQAALAGATRQHSASSSLIAALMKPSKPVQQEEPAKQSPLSGLRDLLARTPVQFSAVTMAGSPLQQSELDEQARLALRRLLDSYKWLKKMFKGIPDHLLKTHPFFHHPEGQLRLSNKTVNMNRIKQHLFVRQKAICVLTESRALLKKKFLATDEYEALVDLTERLCAYASSSMSTNLSTRSGAQVLGRMLIVFDTLYCAAEALGRGSMRSDWWPIVADRIESTRLRRRAKSVEEAYWSPPAHHALAIALEYYKMGLRAPLRLVVGLKLVLFISPGFTDFKETKWDPWRQDAVQWFDAIAMRVQHHQQTLEEEKDRRL